MSEKHDLAELYRLMDGPVDEFVSSKSFKRLEQESDVVKHIEPFGLPEVNKLICCSSTLAEQEWAAKYSDAKKLYTVGKLDILTLLNQYKDATAFEEKILK